MPPSLLLRTLGDIYRRVERLGVSPVVAGGLTEKYIPLFNEKASHLAGNLGIPSSDVFEFV